jgi:hypothetical protein
MRKLEELLDLPPMESFEDDQPESDPEPKTEVQMSNAITIEEKVDHALELVSDIGTHDGEMDDIAQRALESYEELREYGLNSSDAHAGKILEVASQMLKTALDARNSKSERRLKTIDLQLKSQRLKQATNKEAQTTQGGEFDRNELIKLLINKNQE